ncbi:MAG: gliding motility-associated C-terminal domain-containing protein [Saprospiraceae bacterium]|nr:gliding motility-associated C-terminal domain-containing protein [Saprospiraceae bacterium]
MKHFEVSLATMGKGFQLCLIVLFSMSSSYSPLTKSWSVEICNNAIDDDLDGLIDLNDPDCLCSVAEPVSLIPNPSFEERSCCPENRGSLYCADTWIQASEATTDYLHECGWFGWDQLPVPLPLPDGQACIGFRNGRFGEDNSNPNWKEYTGACLTSPLKAGTAYKFQFWIGFTQYENSPPLNVVFYGSPDCKNLPFGQGDERFGCPLNGEGWIELDRIFAGGSNSWHLKEFNVIPDEDIYAIAIGPDCTELNLTQNPYYFLDNLILADIKEFELVISPNQHPCSPSFSLALPLRQTSSYQWYRNGVALIGETGHELITSLEGKYEVMVIDMEGVCKITKPYFYSKPFDRISITRHVCSGESIDVHGRLVSESGVFVDTFKTINNCDSIIETVVQKVDPIEVDLNAKIFRGESYAIGPENFSEPISETVVLQSRLGCDSTVNLNLDFYNVYIPNAVTPNGDGINDGFAVYGSGDLTSIQSMQVYNRWGNRIFTGSNLSPNQMIDISRSSETSSELFTYIVELLMDDGNLHRLHGSFVVLH